MAPSDPIGTLWSSTIAVQVASFFAGSGRAESTASARTQESGSGSASSELLDLGRVDGVDLGQPGQHAPAQVDVVADQLAQRGDLVGR